MKYNNILLTNDDGYDSIGLKILQSYFSKEHSNYKVVAPIEQRSGASAAITIYGTLKVEKHGEQIYAVGGTPVDCVKFALKNVFDPLPNLVVSGINKGDNSGESVIYSGTVGAVIESAVQGCNSVAMSLFTDADEKVGFNEDALENMVSDFFDNEYVDGFVSVNFPPCDYKDFKGFKWLEVSTSTFVEKYEEIEDGLFKICLDYYREAQNSETTYLKENWATISPMKIDFTDHERLATHKK